MIRSILQWALPVIQLVFVVLAMILKNKDLGFFDSLGWITLIAVGIVIVFVLVGTIVSSLIVMPLVNFFTWLY